MGDAITAVISTYQRPDACERALRSVLAQTAPPLEVLVCDNGSQDDTPERMRAWEDSDARVRYLRVERNSGTPASSRNLGIEHAQGEWIAFLDDDDEWLPHKLERQSVLLDPGVVVASNALRTNLRPYFVGAPAMRVLGARDVLTVNPVIQSSAVVPRALLRSVGGYPTARWFRRVEDYGLWLALADRGARFIIVGEPLLRYTDTGEGRFGEEPVRTQLALARLRWIRAARRPRESAYAVRQSGIAAVVAATAWRRAHPHEPR